MMIKYLTRSREGYYNESNIVAGEGLSVGHWCVWHPVYKRITNYFSDDMEAYSVDSAIHDALGGEEGIWDDGL